MVVVVVAAGIAKLQYLLRQTSFPAETFENILLLYIKYEVLLLLLPVVVVVVVVVAGIAKLQYLLGQTSFPAETFENILLLYIKYEVILLDYYYYYYYSQHHFAL